MTANRIEESFPNMDLSGKLIIKVQLGEDIRRIPIHNEDITYDELVLMMQRVFRGRLTSNDEVTLKYKDEDGDLITIFDSSDLSFAIQCSRILKLTLFVNGQPRPLEGDDVKQIRQDLREIRDRVNHLLDRLEPSSPSIASMEETMSDRASVEGAKNTPTRQTLVRPAANVAESKEFDPLSTQKSKEENTQNKVMSSFGISNDAAANGPGRPSSPGGESLSSIGSSSAGNQKHQQQYGQQGAPQAQGYPTATTGQAHPGYQQQPGYPQQQAGYSQPSAQQPVVGQPGQPGQQDSGQQPAQTGYQGQAQAPGQVYQGQQAQAGPPGAMSAAGGPQYPVTTSQPQQAYQPPQGYGQVNYGQPQHPQQQAQYVYPQGQGTPPAAGAQAGNPYSRGPTYGQYPRPQGQYPQAPPSQAPTGFQ